MDVANSLEADARDLEGRARQRAGQLEASACQVLRENGRSLSSSQLRRSERFLFPPIVRIELVDGLSDGQRAR